MFTVDSRTENFLNQIGVKWEYCDAVPFAHLRKEWKHENIGRAQAYDPDAVLEYGSRMEQGSAAPAVIVIEEGDGLSVLDGVQRLHAAELNNQTTFSAYQLGKRSSRKAQHIIRIAANAQINGQHTPDAAWILEQAVSVLLVGDRMSVEEVARAIGRPAAKVKAEADFQRTVRHMADAGYSGTMATRAKKWFVVQLAERVQVEDWQQAPEPVVKMVKVFDHCKFKNGSATHLLDAFFSVNRSPKKDRVRQFEQKLSDLQQDPEVLERVKSGTKRSHIEDLLTALRAAGTIAEKAKKANQVVHDGEFAELLANALRVLYADTKSLVPRDLRFVEGKHSSIFSKG
tara:strand:+ start:1497 stop:2525 length:1029 start_codon:yes stop_codon:yes gene_type:complete